MPGQQHDTHADAGQDGLNANLLVVFGVTLMAVLGVSSVTPAFPRMIRELGVSRGEITWLISAFTLPGVLFAPVMGVLADRWGRKRVLIPSLIIFAVAGSACAFSRDFGVLVALRFIQGVGAASLNMINVTIMGDLYSGRRRTTVMGYNASVLSAGTAGYPALGGLLAMFGWRWPFLLPAVALPLAIVAMFFLRTPEPRTRTSLGQYFGDVFTTVNNRQAIGLLSLGALTFVVLYGAFITYFPLLLDGAFGIKPVFIGLLMSSTSIVSLFVSSRVVVLVRHYNERTLLVVGFLFFALSMVTVPFVRHPLWYLAPTLIFGMGTGLVMPCLQSRIASLAPAAHRAAVLSLSSMVFRLGQTLGPLVMGLAAVHGIGTVYILGCVLSLVMAAIARGTVK